jgi:hypothetical protein
MTGKHLAAIARHNQQLHSHSFARYLTVSEVIMQWYQCSMDSLKRSPRRVIGLPTTRDAGILSNFMKGVHGAIETELGAPVTSIAPAFPQLAPCVKSITYGAIALAGFTSTRTKTEHGDTYVHEEEKAAWAGLDYGQCETWTNYVSCVSDGKSEEYETISYFNFDNSSFSVGTMVVQNALQEYGTLYYGVDTKLGWWDLPVFEAARAQFWARIHEKILDVLEGMSRHTNSIVLMSEHGVNAEFKEVVKAMMWEKFEFNVNLMLEAVKKESAGKLAARGAAELGW